MTLLLSRVRATMEIFSRKGSGYPRDLPRDIGGVEFTAEGLGFRRAEE